MPVKYVQNHTAIRMTELHRSITYSFGRVVRTLINPIIRIVANLSMLRNIIAQFCYYL